MGITKKNLNAFFTTKLFLVIALNTEFSDEIACLIVVIVFYIRFRNLGNISKNVGGIRILILPYATLLDIETRETEKLFAEYAEIVVG